MMRVHFLPLDPTTGEPVEAGRTFCWPDDWAYYLSLETDPETGERLKLRSPSYKADQFDEAITDYLVWREYLDIEVGANGIATAQDAAGRWYAWGVRADDTPAVAPVETPAERVKTRPVLDALGPEAWSVES